MDREAADVDDRTAAIRHLPGHRSRTLAAELDDHHAAGVLSLRDLGRDALAVVRAGGREERPHVLVRVELDEELDVAGLGRTDRDAHGRTVAASRRGSRIAPEASATPPRISARPISVAAVIASSRISAP